ncbi:hypothetical protein AB0C33_02025 [Nonomuraea sp. NPDC048881]|uniref:hypothetical protein n=1 Tax=Nonomuraea sp. NPDC048881 TaxID=3155030 RepID=UPI0033F196DD
MGAERIYDHGLIRRILKDNPRLVHDARGMAERYNRVKGEDAITPTAIRHVVYQKYETWFGKQPVVKRGQRQIHDRKRIAALKRDFPRASAREIANLYNGGWIGKHLGISALYKIIEEMQMRK